MHFPLLMAGFLTLLFTALNLLPIGQFDGGHVVYGLFGAKVAGIVSRVTVIVLLVVGATGVMKIPEDIPTWEEGLLEFLLWHVVTTFIYIWLLHRVALRMSSRIKMPLAWAAAIGFAGLQFLACLAFPQIQVMGVGLGYAFMSTLMMGYDHPKALDDRPLSWGQKILGVLALLIFVLCFSMNPLDIVMP
jgi:membrane-associated protease RseP (regulator of RpoE activity)